jgi:hypothetical protein
VSAKSPRVAAWVFALALVAGALPALAQERDVTLIGGLALRQMAQAVITQPPSSLVTASDKFQYSAPPQPFPLTAAEQIVSIKEYLYQIISERDRQYAQRFEAQQKAVDAALIAQDKATAAAFAAAEKAVAAALSAQEKATNAALLAANTAMQKADTANEKRFDGVNEFRGQLKDQAATLASRAELTILSKALSDKIDAITTEQTQMRARAEGANNLWTILGGIVVLLTGLAVAVVSFRRGAIYPSKLP